MFIQESDVLILFVSILVWYHVVQFTAVNIFIVFVHENLMVNLLSKTYWSVSLFQAAPASHYPSIDK